MDGRLLCMSPIYLGVDVGGMNNTWMAALSASGDGLIVVHGPCLVSLEEIAGYCEDNDVVAVAIDAQLTAALSEENGFRTSDCELRDMLHQRRGSRNWVASANGLMAVPVRGRLLAEHLAPTVGTLLETHPRASLLFGLGHEENQEEIRTAIREYKKKSNDTKKEAEARKPHVRKLWWYWSGQHWSGQHWSGHFFHSDSQSLSVYDDGALDALVCATVAYCFHHAPETLHRLRHGAEHKVGRGPFYVMTPNADEQALDEAIDDAEEVEPDQPAPEEEAAPEGVIVRVTGESGQSFAGSYGNVDSTISVDGAVPQEHEVEVDDGLMEYDVVTVIMQKNTPGSWELGAEIVVDGEVVKEASTTAEYGVAQVSWETAE